MKHIYTLLICTILSLSATGNTFYRTLAQKTQGVVSFLTLSLSDDGQYTLRYERWQTDRPGTPGNFTTLSTGNYAISHDTLLLTDKNYHFQNLFIASEKGYAAVKSFPFVNAQQFNLAPVNQQDLLAYSPEISTDIKLPNVDKQAAVTHPVKQGTYHNQPQDITITFNSNGTYLYVWEGHGTIAGGTYAQYGTYLLLHDSALNATYYLSVQDGSIVPILLPLQSEDEVFEQ